MLSKKHDITGTVKLVLLYKKTDGDDIDSDSEEELKAKGNKVQLPKMLIVEDDKETIDGIEV